MYIAQICFHVFIMKPCFWTCYRNSRCIYINANGIREVLMLSASSSAPREKSGHCIFTLTGFNEGNFIQWIYNSVIWNENVIRIPLQSNHMYRGWTK
jgi:hypothetical protein